MNDPNLITLSLSAFVAVLVVLSVLALVIRALAFVFRAPPVAARGPDPAAATTSAGDAALVAAIHATLAQHRPGYRVTRIEERTTRGAS